MSVLARMLRQSGAPVAGSDRVESSYTRQLEELGIPVAIGQKAENVDDADTVVWSSAIPADAPEMLEARRLGKRLAHRSDILALLLRVHRSIAVAGTHGKTTTASLIATILQTAGEKPSFAIGGSLKTPDGIVPGGRVGTGRWIVAEADESDGSFGKYRPTIAVITNAEGDHLDHYGTIARYRAAFESFAGQAQQAIVLCGDDEGAREVYNHLPQDAVDRTVVYATTPFDEMSPLMPALDAGRFAFVGSPAEIPVGDDSRLRELEDATAAAMSSGSSVIVDEGVQETFALAMPAALLNGGHPRVRSGRHQPDPGRRRRRDVPRRGPALRFPGRRRRRPPVHGLRPPSDGNRHVPIRRATPLPAGHGPRPVPAAHVLAHPDLRRGAGRRARPGRRRVSQLSIRRPRGRQRLSWRLLADIDRRSGAPRRRRPVRPHRRQVRRGSRHGP